MTVSISKDENNAYGGAKLRYTYGPVTLEFAEDAGHWRGAWAELGRVLDEIEHEQAAKRAAKDASSFVGGAS
jgi:hypothetical protein